MAETAKYNLTEAASENGTVNFYTLLNQEPSADTDTLRTKIKALYAEAQANRDHRNLTRRREYQTLLELLPPARAVLLDEQKRQAYDDYLAADAEGANEVDFETFMNDLMGLNEEMEEKTGLLGVQDKPEIRARVLKTPPPTPRKRVPEPVAAKPSPASVGIMGGIGGFVLGALIGFLITHNPIPTLLIGILLGAIGFVVLNRQAPRRIRR